jgi:hypothetical protein
MSAALEMIMRNLRTEMKRMEKQHQDDTNTIHMLKEMLNTLKAIYEPEPKEKEVIDNDSKG